MRVVVGGSHGFIGGALVPLLQDRGHEVRRLVRRAPASADEIFWDPDAGELDPAALNGVDAVVDLAGVNPAGRPLTTARKRLVLSSRVRSASLLSHTLARMDDGPRVLLQASGIGAYGPRGEDVLTEAEPLGSTFFAHVVREWESATASARDADVRVVNLRTGIVLGPGGGALGPLLPIMRLGLAGRLGSGEQYWPWISLLDEARAIEHLLSADVHGPVNLVTEPRRSIEVIEALARAMHRPARVPVPAFALRLALGDFSSEVLGSVRAIPTALVASGFEPELADLDDAAAWAVTTG
ncbi:TIGR01777 family protein [Cellulomonas sp. JH27-2]|uniref:TIGR01777 family oxidoreductase n=1 Tax=Cellulomonas sp. JH27-2 TaxID=2774139 RepID=UPI00177C5F57|nr:TIGR01777 family oxidoreductase [Cellulomonas sp. JH27-2]MBD8058538.1 TIGR01777 family protein [Cellulomonas sp. JH27-2]